MHSIQEPLLQLRITQGKLSAAVCFKASTSPAAILLTTSSSSFRIRRGSPFSAVSNADNEAPATAEAEGIEPREQCRMGVLARGSAGSVNSRLRCRYKKKFQNTDSMCNTGKGVTKISKISEISLSRLVWFANSHRIIRVAHCIARWRLPFPGHSKSRGWKKQRG